RDARVAGSIQLDGEVSSRHYRSGYVFHSHGCCCTMGITVDISDGQGHRVGAYVSAIEAGLVKRHACDPTSIRRTVVDFRCSDAPSSDSMQLTGDAASLQ